MFESGHVSQKANVTEGKCRFPRAADGLTDREGEPIEKEEKLPCFAML